MFHLYSLSFLSFKDNFHSCDKIISKSSAADMLYHGGGGLTVVHVSVFLHVHVYSSGFKLECRISLMDHCIHYLTK